MEEEEATKPGISSSQVSAHPTVTNTFMNIHCIHAYLHINFLHSVKCRLVFYYMASSTDIYDPFQH